MSQLIRISHPDRIPLQNWKAEGKVKHKEDRIVSWEFEADDPQVASITLSFDQSVAFNSFSVDVLPDREDLFPGIYRLEISHDGQTWEPILREMGQNAIETGGLRWHFALTTARHARLVVSVDRPTQKGYGVAIGEISIGVSGAVDLQASGELDRLWVKENLIDGRPDYGWSSPISNQRKEEHIYLDLGSINRVGELRLRSKDDPEPFFPPGFRLAFSEDNISWHHLMDENGFLAEPGTWYRWRFVPQNMRYLKLIVDEGARTREGKYLAQIIEMELYAVSDSLEEKGDRSAAAPIHLPYASVLRSGIVRLSMDGESREGVAVQASDRRLRDATTEAKGIVELATNGEDREGVAVQGNDARLKYATEDLPGIVRLSRNEEVRGGHVVQSNDARIMPATEDSRGIVELAADGEDRADVVVQGNDRRLKYAKEDAAGILKLAPDGSSTPGQAVQGNDRRLREATTETVGVLRFASHGEKAKFAAVQSSDPRLRDATTEAKGIVELATGGEDREGVVVQGNDPRLRNATVDSVGVIALNPPGSSLEGRAVQGNDPRLSDAREPVPHEHDYAPARHTYDSHEGYVSLEADMGEDLSGIGSVPKNHSPIQGSNTGKGAGLSGAGRLDGVIGSGARAGVTGLSPVDGVGVLGASRRGPGGRFFSEQDYSLVVGGKEEDRKLSASRLGLNVFGVTRMNDSLLLNASSDHPMEAVVAAYFPVERADVIVPGDLLIAGREPGFVQKSKDALNSSIIGVSVETASLILGAPTALDNRGREAFTGLMKVEGQILVAIGGIVHVRAKIGETGEIKPGDPLVSSAELGCAMKAPLSGQAPGAIFAKSLDRLPSGEGMIRVVLGMG